MLNESNNISDQAQQVQALMLETLQRYRQQIDAEDGPGLWGREIAPAVVIRVYYAWRYYPQRRVQYEGPLGIWLMRVDEEGNPLEVPIRDEQFTEQWSALQKLREEAQTARWAYQELRGQLPRHDVQANLLSLDEYEQRWGNETPAGWIAEVWAAWAASQELQYKLGQKAHALGLPLYDVSEWRLRLAAPPEQPVRRAGDGAPEPEKTPHAAWDSLSLCLADFGLRSRFSKRVQATSKMEQFVETYRGYGDAYTAAHQFLQHVLALPVAEQAEVLEAFCKGLRVEEEDAGWYAEGKAKATRGVIYFFKREAAALRKRLAD